MPLIELHVHTKAGSADSSISVEELGAYARAEGVEALVVAEHFRVWSDWERDAFHARYGARVYRAIEATTDAGHIVLIGPPAGYSPPRSALELLSRAEREGWFAVLAHPFRHYYDDIHPGTRPAFEADLTPDALAASPIFERVHAIEVENGACTDRENALAHAVAQHLALPVTTGSDAHGPAELGRRRLRIDAVPADEGDLIDLVRSWRLGGLPAEAAAGD